LTMNEFFQHFCGSAPGHVWAPGGELLPLCQRCTGLYAGAVIAALAMVLLRPRIDRRFLWIHGAFLLLMIPFGFHLVPQGAALRTVTGILFGTGVVAFLWPARGSRGNTAYFAAILASCIALPLVGRFGNHGAHSALVALSLAGLGSLALLIASRVVNCFRALGDERELSLR